MKPILPLALILAVLAAAMGGLWYLTRSASAPSNATSTADPAPTPAKPAQPGADPAHSIGAIDAPVTIEEFGDFQCPPCGRLHPLLKLMESEFGSSLKIVFREFPLPVHAHAQAAARAAEAAGMQGKFWEMHDLLYENQTAWAEAFDVRLIFEGYANRIGLDLARYKRDLGSTTIGDRIFQDDVRAHSLNVQGTPTAFLNGKEVPFDSLMNVEKLRAAIRAELNSKSQH